MFLTSGNALVESAAHPGAASVRARGEQPGANICTCRLRSATKYTPTSVSVLLLCEEVLHTILRFRPDVRALKIDNEDWTAD